MNQNSIRVHESKPHSLFFIFHNHTLFFRFAMSTHKFIWFYNIFQVKQMRLQTLRGELEAMKMNDSEDVFSYITCVQTVANKLKRNG